MPGNRHGFRADFQDAPALGHGNLKRRVHGPVFRRHRRIGRDGNLKLREVPGIFDHRLRDGNHEVGP